MSDILDLDALVPPSRYIKLNGKQYECKPLTIRQLVEIAHIEKKLAEITSEDEIIPIIREALKPFIPAIENEEVDFTIPQFRAIIQFAQTSAIPEKATEAREYDPKKKVASAEE